MTTRFTREDLTALADAVYAEARGESRRGQRAVAHAVVNRATTGGASIRQTVYAANQFSGLMRSDPNRAAVEQANLADPAYVQAVKVAKDVLTGKSVDPTKGATYYHTPAVNPNWSSAPGFEETAKIGGHQFYSAPKREVLASVRRPQVPPVTRDETFVAELDDAIGLPIDGKTGEYVVDESSPRPFETQPTQRRQMAVDDYGAPFEGAVALGSVAGSEPEAKPAVSFVDYAGLTAKDPKTGRQIEAMAPEGREFMEGFSGNLDAMGAAGYDVPDNPTVTSGYRTYDTDPRTHPTGTAFDFRTTDLSEPEQRSAALAAIGAGAKGLGVFGAGDQFAPHMHADLVGAWGDKVLGQQAGRVIPDVKATLGEVPMSALGSRVGEAIGKGVVLPEGSISPDWVNYAAIPDAPPTAKPEGLTAQFGAPMREPANPPAAPVDMQQPEPMVAMREPANPGPAPGMVSPAEIASRIANGFDAISAQAPEPIGLTPGPGQAVAAPVSEMPYPDAAMQNYGPTAPDPFMGAPPVPSPAPQPGPAIDPAMDIPDYGPTGEPMPTQYPSAPAGLPPTPEPRPQIVGAAPGSVPRPAPQPVGAAPAAVSPPAAVGDPLDLSAVPEPVPGPQTPADVPVPQPRPDWTTTGDVLGQVGGTLLGGAFLGPGGARLGSWLGKKLGNAMGFDTPVRALAGQYIQSPKEVAAAVEAGWSSPGGDLNGSFDQDRYWSSISKTGFTNSDLGMKIAMSREQRERKAAGLPTWGDAFNPKAITDPIKSAVGTITDPVKAAVGSFTDPVKAAVGEVRSKFTGSYAQKVIDETTSPGRDSADRLSPPTDPQKESTRKAIDRALGGANEQMQANRAAGLPGSVPGQSSGGILGNTFGSMFGNSSGSDLTEGGNYDSRSRYSDNGTPMPPSRPGDDDDVTHGGGGSIGGLY